VWCPVFKLPVTELVLRGALRVEPVETRRRGRRRQRSALTDGPRLRMRPPPALAPVLDVYSTSQKRALQATDESAAGMRPIEGVPTEDFAKAGRKRFGGQLNKYVRKCVLPLLSGAGLMTTTAAGFASARAGPAAAGRRRTSSTNGWPSGSATFAHGCSATRRGGSPGPRAAGPPVLLMNDFYPQFVRLGQFLADRRVPADGRGAEIGVPLSLDHPLGAEAGSELSGVELSHLDLGLLATDVGGFDSLDGAFTAIDAGIGAGDFGGGGGGGDGGGGGG
jgi:hypothetical protein